MAWTPSKRGNSDQQTKIRVLAERKGYRAEHALMTGHWYLFDAAGEKARTPGGSFNFPPAGVLDFLKRKPDAPPPLAEL